MAAATVFVTGGTGYVDRPLLVASLARGNAVHALARSASASRLPAGVTTVLGDALDAASFVSAIPARATLVHLVGTPHPNPSKAAEFERVDLGSIRAAASAAESASVAHIVYVSVAHPAPGCKSSTCRQSGGHNCEPQCEIPPTTIDKASHEQVSEHLGTHEVIVARIDA